MSCPDIALIPQTNKQTAVRIADFSFAIKNLYSLSGKKANECTGETPSLVPPPPRTHIDGCVLLNIGHADATYLLTNPDYPNITKQ